MSTVLRPGSALGRYRIVERLGEGGMGSVYRANDPRLERDVALKVLHADPDHGRAEDRRRQLRLEARALSRLLHPNIATLFDLDSHDGVDFLVLEYVPGHTLAWLLESGPLPEPRARAIALEVAEALEAAHEQGVVHRDLKPGNVILNPRGRAKVLDFGLARFQGSSSVTLTTLSARDAAVGVAGTLPYMSPEQIRGERTDARTDVWAMGAIMYEMCAGARPFTGTDFSQLLYRIVNEPPPPLRELKPGVPQAYATIVARCLEKDPARRFADAAALRRALKGEDSTETIAVPVTRAEPAAPISTSGRIHSLAVLPLANRSGDPSQEFFVDGMTDALIADLAQIGALRVISRTSVMQFKGSKKSLPEIAKELGVDHIVTASVMQSGGRVRITAELVDGATDQHLWANAYERELSDVMTLQAEVARAIADEVRVRLTPQEAGRLARSRKVVPAALNASLLGRYHWDRYTVESLLKSIEYFEQASQLDPDFAAAYSGMAESRGGLFQMGASLWEETIPQARLDAAKALSLDDSSAEAHQASGFIHYLEWDWKGAEEENKKAISLNPAFPNVYVLECNILRHLGRKEDSIAAAKRGLEVDPLGMITNLMLGQAYVNARRYDLAIAQYQKALELHPNDSTLLHHLGWAYVYNGQYDKGRAAIESSSKLEGLDERLDPHLAYLDAVNGNQKEARQTLSRLLELAKQYTIQPGLIALIYVGLNEPNEALAWLEKAYQMHSTMMVWLKVDPRFDRIRQEPGFQELMRRVGLI